MAYISQRGAYWRAEVRRRGYKPVYRSFDTKQKAQQWARRVESEMDSAAYVDRTEAERTRSAKRWSGTAARSSPRSATRIRKTDASNAGSTTICRIEL